ncbi:CidA/LrgA family protein [Longimicrobium sp.]|uniref:CidA/LrgA family protein n=1 Tax=Longimicrobium sp. TaxID=2029185 RepID=UPI002B5FC246|nr:CidA/LrgA family protein [Longimicrobium sp.]HSU15128.1 CidA/LrgA family protein [Longimicrobium sp.]
MINRTKMLEIARGIAILLAFLYLGDAVSALLHLPLPGSVVGMVLLAVSLQRKWLPFEWVRPAAHLLIRHMSLLYIPPGVGVMVYFGLIRREWLPLAAAGVVGMVAVLLAVGVLQQRLERRG